MDVKAERQQATAGKESDKWEQKAEVRAVPLSIPCLDSVCRWRGVWSAAYSLERLWCDENERAMRSPAIAASRAPLDILSVVWRCCSCFLVDPASRILLRWNCLSGGTPSAAAMLRGAFPSALLFETSVVAASSCVACSFAVERAPRFVEPFAAIAFFFLPCGRGRCLRSLPTPPPTFRRTRGWPLASSASCPASSSPSKHRVSRTVTTMPQAAEEKYRKGRAQQARRRDGGGA
ncbi:hypothetical protein MSAN_02059900 [Mycena sanguinolenta]|uniref:Uncharacterized protein n=1 Tax=Mycena sanguinolenta TaxID=230812 RepID=A0A8H6XHI8_9AGAR|nr:hypothetical protein MSAN_02059900 [Mycena sanguinolenta]